MKKQTNPSIESENRDVTIARMFSKISPWYDFLNHFLSLGVDIYWRKKMISSIEVNKSNPVFLDLATGTMDVIMEIERRFEKKRPKIMGIDLSYEMLYRGKKKIQGKNVTSICANAKELPICSSCIDIVTIAFGIRNITPRGHTYKEVLRILRPGGKFLILEFASAQKKILFGIYNIYLSHILPTIGRLISKDKIAYNYLSETIKKFPLAHELKKELLNAGFSKVCYYPLTFGIVHLYIAEK